MTGKDKCRILKEIRRQIAEENEIEWVVSECRHKGKCKGTCPRCESEVRKLEQELARRRSLGKKVALVGISALCLTGMVGCGISKPGPDDQIAGEITYVEPETNEITLDGDITPPEEYSNPGETELSGDVAYPEEIF